MKIDFEFDTPYGKFADAIWIDDDAIPSDAEIEAVKQQRLNDWLDIFKYPVMDLLVEDTPPDVVA